ISFHFAKSTTTTCNAYIVQLYAGLPAVKPPAQKGYRFFRAAACPTFRVIIVGRSSQRFFLVVCLPARRRFLKQAGYEVRHQQLVNVKTGEPYANEFLTDGSGFERVFLFYKPSLDRLGMATTLRTVDEVQY